MLRFLEKYKISLVYVPLTVYWLIIFTLTTLPSQSLPSTSINDKIAHLLAYYFLGALLVLALFIQKKFKSFNKRYLFFAAGICMLYGAADELHQMFIPGRFADILDWTADTIGAISGIFTVYFLLIRNSIKR